MNNKVDDKVSKKWVVKYVFAHFLNELFIKSSIYKFVISTRMATYIKGKLNKTTNCDKQFRVAAVYYLEFPKKIYLNLDFRRSLYSLFNHPRIHHSND